MPSQVTDAEVEELRQAMQSGDDLAMLLWDARKNAHYTAGRLKDAMETLGERLLREAKQLTPEITEPRPNLGYAYSPVNSLGEVQGHASTIDTLCAKLDEEVKLVNTLRNAMKRRAQRDPASPEFVKQMEEKRDLARQAAMTAQTQKLSAAFGARAQAFEEVINTVNRP